MNTDRFKFRAWSIKEQKYYYNIENAYSDDYKNCQDIPNYIDGDNHYYFGSILNDDKYIIEQCTGIKDCHGKLIYEGDLIRSVDEIREKQGVLEWCDGDGIFSGSWHVHEINTSSIAVSCSFDSYWEVYGNVHNIEKYKE